MPSLADGTASAASAASRASSHPDCHRRYRSFTDSTARTNLAGRGLSPPVRIFTDPGARVLGNKYAPARHGRPPREKNMAQPTRRFHVAISVGHPIRTHPSWQFWHRATDLPRAAQRRPPQPSHMALDERSGAGGRKWEGPGADRKDQGPAGSAAWRPIHLDGRLVLLAPGGVLGYLRALWAHRGVGRPRTRDGVRAGRRGMAGPRGMGRGILASALGAITRLVNPTCLIIAGRVIAVCGGSVHLDCFLILLGHLVVRSVPCARMRLLPSQPRG